MEVEFERGLYNNLMVIKNREYTVDEEDIVEDYKADYQVYMLSGEGAEGFLPLKLRYYNGRSEFCYDISSKQRFSEWFKGKKLNYDALCRILQSLCRALESAVDYMLDANHVILNPDYIFMDTEKYSLQLCYYPFYGEDILRSGQEFLQYLLEIIDYNDKAAVEVGYEAFRLCMKDGFSIELLRNFKPEEKDKKINLEIDEEKWNSIVPVKVMGEEVEDECEKSMIPYMKPKFRKKICFGLIISEIIVSLMVIFVFKTSPIILLIYVLVSVLLVGAVLGLSVFYEKVERWTRLVAVKGYVTYKNSETDYTCNVVWEEEKAYDAECKKEYEETVLLAYTGKEERPRRLHYIGTRNQEDITLTGYPFTVGKSTTDTDYCLPYPFVSRIHFRIDREEDKYFITDTNSRNGLSVNDTALNATETKELRVGDRVELGDLVFLFQ